MFFIFSTHGGMFQELSYFNVDKYGLHLMEPQVFVSFNQNITQDQTK